jgi:hypothetical protein
VIVAVASLAASVEAAVSAAAAPVAVGDVLRPLELFLKAPGCLFPRPITGSTQYCLPISGHSCRTSVVTNNALKREPLELEPKQHVLKYVDKMTVNGDVSPTDGIPTVSDLDQ